MDIGKMFGHQHQQVTVTQAQLDTFINRVVAEKDETLYSMAQVLQYKLQQAPMVSVAESQVYPLVIQRIQQRLQNGEK